MTMDDNVHDGREQRQHREQLTEPQLEGFERQPGARENVPAEEHGHPQFVYDDPLRRELQFKKRKEPKADKEEEQQEEIELCGEDRNAEVSTEVLEQERSQPRGNDARKRLGTGPAPVLAHN